MKRKHPFDEQGREFISRETPVLYGHLVELERLAEPFYLGIDIEYQDELDTEYYEEIELEKEDVRPY